MAKRKRLTPAKIDTPDIAPDATGESAPETKTVFPRYPLGVAPTRTIRPPIADVAQDASASAALTEIAQTLTDARNEGRLIQPLPLGAIQTDYLVRDRMETDADEMATLRESLRTRGQQTAIEVTALENGRYGLISGWRRVAALRMLAEEDPTIETVLAIVRTPADAADAYQAMVEENEIRVGLSNFERARIVARATDAGVFNRDRVALVKLFGSASRPKRSKIGSFLRIVRALEDALHFPTQLNERNGLALAQALDADPSVAGRVRTALAARPPADAAAEAAVIASALGAAPETEKYVKSPLKTAPEAQLVRAGLRLKETAKGDIVLSGAMVKDPDFRAALVAFLQK